MDGDVVPDEESGPRYPDLVLTAVEGVPGKDVVGEVRGQTDIDQIAEDDRVVFDLNASHTSASDLVDALLEKMKVSYEMGDAAVEQAREGLLTQEEVPRIRRMMQGSGGSGFAVAMAEVAGPVGKKERNRGSGCSRAVAVCTLSHATNLGPGSEGVHVVVVVVCSLEVKGTKSAHETARTISTVLAHEDALHALREAESDGDARAALKRFLGERREEYEWSEHAHELEESDPSLTYSAWPFAGLWKDIHRRMPWYFSDFVDGFVGRHTVRRVVATVAFLYFACILPAIAFGVLNEHQTEGQMDVRKMILAQGIGGVVFSLIGGQPLIVMLSTAPLALYIKVIYAISAGSGFAFFAMYAWVGLWTAVFLALYAATEASVLMKYSTRFAEETFGVFISIAFAYDALRPMVEDFIHNFYSCPEGCMRDVSLLFFILLFGTALIGYWLWDAHSSKLLNGTLREYISAYSLPIAVLLMSLLGSGVFRPVPLPPFPFVEKRAFQFAPLLDIPLWGIAMSAGMGWVLSLLFFMDQNISSAMVNSPSNHLKKGAAYHADLYVVAMLTAFLSIMGLPWVHAALPHSPLHARHLADYETVIVDGVLQERVIRVRETRITGLVSHLLIILSVLAVPYPLQEIPVPVLYGVFLYLSITALPGNQFWERLQLFFTQQSSYPPTSIVRRVPQRTIHLFTCVQVLCLIVLIFFGFIPVDYIQLFVAIPIIMLIPARLFIISHLFPDKYLHYLDPITA